MLKYTYSTLMVSYEYKNTVVKRKSLILTESASIIDNESFTTSPTPSLRKIFINYVGHFFLETYINQFIEIDFTFGRGILAFNT